MQIVIKQKQAVGRFRISMTDAASSPFALVPTECLTVLDIPPAKRSEAELPAIAAHALIVVADLESAKLPEPTSFYVVSGALPHEGKASDAAPVSILKRGDMAKPVAKATPGALSCIPELTARVDDAEMRKEAPRRAFLAKWLSDPKNPLTWRSVVNRAWHHHFGRGIVDTVNDFGHMGSTPTHPELLDWLAAEFRDNGMSLKKLHKLIVTSAAYRQLTAPNDAALKIDADNRLLWRMNRQRLDAESFRDAILAVSGRLDPKMGGPGVFQFEVKAGFNTTKLANYEKVDWNSDAVRRRSVYRFIFRTRPDPFMSALDYPDASQFVTTRSTSVTPLQALVLFNNHFVLHHCEKLAEQVAAKNSDTVEQVRAAFRLALQREPEEAELAEFVTYSQQHGLMAACRVLLNSNEFLFLE